MGVFGNMGMAFGIPKPIGDMFDRNLEETANNSSRTKKRKDEITKKRKDEIESASPKTVLSIKLEENKTLSPIGGVCSNCKIYFYSVECPRFYIVKCPACGSDIDWVEKSTESGDKDG